jgi:hypothetical protein
MRSTEAPGARAAVVDDPEHAPRRSVGLAGHDLLDQPPERLDPRPGLEAVKQAGVVDVPGGQVSQRPTAPTLELDQRRAPGPGRHRLISGPERLQLGLLIGADDEVAGCGGPPSHRRA